MNMRSLKSQFSDALNGLREPWAATLAGDTATGRTNDIFHSARLKLTAFYFAILVVFCLLLTIGVHTFTVRELNRGDDARRGAIHQLFQQYEDQMPGINDFTPPSDRSFARTQAQQSDQTRENLNRDFFCSIWHFWLAVQY